MENFSSGKHNLNLTKKFFSVFLVGFLLIQPVFISAESPCWDECSYEGQREESGDYYRTCGNYDTDYCLEWSEWQEKDTTTCWDECAYEGQREESGNYYRICGNYDSDSCLEWSEWQTEEPTCWDECSYSGQRRCSDSTHYQICGEDYDSDYCLEWSSPQYCGSGKICQNGECIAQCTSHYTKKCYSNDLYWYDSCDNREGKYQECGSDSWTDNYRCSGDWVQREKNKKGCAYNTCYTNSQWENYQDCSTSGKVCQDGECISSPPLCWDECSYSGQRRCSDSTHYQICGEDYDSDYCLEWSSPQYCGSGKICTGEGECVIEETNDPITGSLTVSSYSVCVGKSISVALTGQDDNGVIQLKLMIDDGDEGTYSYNCSGATSCSKTWQITKNVAGTYKLTAKFFGKKPDGTSEVYSIDDIFIEYKECLAPTVDIKANDSNGPITVPYNTSVILSWISTDTNSCQASGAWSGSKPTSGSEPTGNLTSCSTYALTCSGSGGSASDSVTINVTQNHPPVANAGPDKEVYETESVILEGSGSDPDGDSITYQWTCNGGILSNPNIARPIFYGPIVSSDTTYTCTLKVTDSRGASDSDSINILVKEHHCLTLGVSLSANPNTGYAPLNDVDLTATVSGTASGPIAYFFDCTNDGNWERTETKNDESYTVYDICDYSSAGNYTAKVRVQREGLSAENTASIYVSAPENHPPISDAGPDKDVYESESVILEGSGSDPDGDPITFSWSCSGGYLSNSNVPQPVFTAYEVGYDISSVCTLSVSDNRGGYSSDSMTVRIKNKSSGYSYLTVDKLVRNLSQGQTGWSDSISADPGDQIEFYLKVTSIGSVSAYDVWVRDILPSKIYYQGDLKIDNFSSSGDIISGINLGTLTPSQTKTITFKAKVASETSFSYGTDSLVNTARIWAQEVSQRTDTAAVYVTRTAPSSGRVDLDCQKLVRNISQDETTWKKTTEADPEQEVEFRIKITSTGEEKAEDIMVKDVLPSLLIYRGSLKIDGKSSSKKITKGFNIGGLSPGQSKTIIFKAKVASEDKLKYGTNNLTNTALAYNTKVANSDTAKVVVSKKAVAGAATEVNTGVINPLYLSLIVSLIFTLIFFFILGNIKYPQNRFLKRITEKYRRFKSFVFSGLR